MSVQNAVIWVTLLTTILGMGTSPVFAVATPSFPACSNPQGTVKVSYPDGVHGIVGDTATYTGSDTVYTLSEGMLMQCFCATNGNGIQSNWLKATPFTQEEISVLKNEGWYLVPNGALWGLSGDPYLVQNNVYGCGGIGGGGGGSTLSSTTQAVVGEIMGLAATGNIAMVYVFLGVSIVSLFASLLLAKRARRI